MDPQTGLYSYTTPRTDHLRREVKIIYLKIPPGMIAVSYYHSHPGYWYVANGEKHYTGSSNEGSEFFSGYGGDTDLANTMNQVITVVTPSDRMIYYNPREKDATQNGKPIIYPKCGCH